MSDDNGKDVPKELDGVDNADEEVNEKSHTFRRRRLTYTKHHLEGAAFNAAAQVAAELGDIDTDDHDGVGGDDRNDNCDSESQSGKNEELKVEVYDDNDLKSKTFRKRRLTFTKHQVASAVASAAAAAALADFGDDDGDADGGQSERGSSNSAENQDEHHNGDSSKAKSSEQQASGEATADDESHPNASTHKKRRLSDDTDASSTGGLWKSKVVHAGEIMRHPPSPSVLRSKESRLYHGPYNLENFQTEEEKSNQPAWTRRMTRRHSEDESKLPFLRSIVGQYSCHGIEPVYDSDYERGEEETDSDDEWMSDLQPSTPRVTTSAKINQDRGGIAFPYGNCAKTALFAVYDGHGQGGELVSQFALHHIPRHLEKHENFSNDIEKAFKDVFQAVDRGLIAEPSIEPLYAGTTACVVLLRDNTLTISNAGDSRVVLAQRSQQDQEDGGDGDLITIQLSQDQNPDVPEEQERIERSGGFVSPPPEPGLSARVWLDAEHTQIGLAMARSIGDHAVKDVGVIAEPVVTFHEIEEEDEFLILASDGVWEFISSEEAVGIVGEHIHKGATRACQALIEAAANRWHEEEGDYRDDITALVVRLQKLWDSPSSVAAAAAVATAQSKL